MMRCRGLLIRSQGAKENKFVNWLSVLEGIFHIISFKFKLKKEIEFTFTGRPIPNLCASRFPSLNLIIHQNDSQNTRFFIFLDTTSDTKYATVFQTNNQFFNSLIPTAYPTVLFYSYSSYHKLVSDSTGLRVQFFKTAPTSDVLQMGYMSCPHVCPINYKSGVPSSDLIIYQND